MALAPGSRLGVYEIEAQIGEGGMGQVFRATDTKLKRRVAIKVLPQAVAADVDRVARFRREAEVLAALNHPRIGAIYGLEESGGLSAIVMELADGETLSHRIASGPIPPDVALAIAGQIGEALEAAHEKGIVHRDLKPANIIVSHDGSIKVLDFGIAKAIETNRADSGGSPTTTAPAMLTDPGMILGTAAYMSPEQARGRRVDTRADIWSFGCVLFEMLTGHSAFPADTASDTLVAVLSREPDWNLLPPHLQPEIRRVLRKCLEKDPRQRLRDIGDARMEIEEALTAPTSMAPPAKPLRARFVWLTRISAAVVLVGLGATLPYWRGRPVVPDAVRLSLTVPGQFFTEPPSAVVSPDGRLLAFVSAEASGKRMLWIRELGLQEARVLPGTEGADLPFWSADGRALGFFADSQLKRVESAGGPVQTVASAPVSPGATWNQDGTILFVSTRGGLQKVLASGGAISTALKPPDGGGIAWPHFLPDGRHFLYFAADPKQGSGVYVGSLDSSDTTRLMTSDFEATYAPPGYLLFVRQESLMAQPFDAARLALTGEPAVVATRVWAAGGYGHGVFSAGANGALAYVNADISNTQLAWFDRSGRPFGTVGPPGRYDAPPQLAPRGVTIAVARGAYFRQDLWFLDPRDGTDTRFTFDPPGSRVPVWSPEGRRIFFQSTRGDGHARLYQKAASGAGAEDALADIIDVNLQDVSPDGRFVVYMRLGKQAHFELWTLPLFGDRRPSPFLQTDFNNGQAQVSPDGHWLAYVSNESGRDEVYVQRFPTAGSKRQISVAGGAQPRWKKSGGELFYLAPDQVLMSVPVKGDELLVVGRPSPLFRTRLEFLGLQGPFFMPGYDVTADGERFLISAPPEHAVAPIDILLNWTAVLDKK